MSESKKPSNSAFKQQRLKAWQPILTPQSVLPTFFVIGLIFVPVGVGLYLTANRVDEYVADYTSCKNYATPTQFTKDDTTYTLQGITDANNNTQCILQVNVPLDLDAPVFLYYRLSNFYQNHRRYVKSYDAKQLQGAARTVSDLTGNCDPLITGIDSFDGIEKPIYPCGLIANSVFNDSYSTMVENTSGKVISWSQQGIAWPSDKNKYTKTAYGNADVIPPPNWAKFNGTYQGAFSLNDFDIENDEAFMVWMRTAGLPTFRKLWGKWEEQLGMGTYTIVIDDRYDVTSFGGTKSLVISTTSWLGGKNLFLGIAYIVVGCVCIALGLAFLARHVMKPRKLGDPSYLSWNKTK